MDCPSPSHCHVETFLPGLPPLSKSPEPNTTEWLHNIIEEQTLSVPHFVKIGLQSRGVSRCVHKCESNGSRGGCACSCVRPLRYHVDTSQRVHCAGAIRGAPNYPIQSQSESRQQKKRSRMRKREVGLQFQNKSTKGCVSLLCIYFYHTQTLEHTLASSFIWVLRIKHRI